MLGWRVLARERSQRQGLMAQMVYGTGMRIGECIALRVKDINWTDGSIHIHSGKGAKDRLTLLPRKIVPALRRHVLS